MPSFSGSDLRTELDFHETKALFAAILNRMPADPFSDDERAALDAHFETRGETRLLGQRELIRLDRAHDARAAFHQQVPENVARLEVPVFSGASHGEVIEHLSRCLQEAPS